VIVPNYHVLLSQSFLVISSFAAIYLMGGFIRSGGPGRSSRAQEPTDRQRLKAELFQEADRIEFFPCLNNTSVFKTPNDDFGCFYRPASWRVLAKRPVVGPAKGKTNCDFVSISKNIPDFIFVV